MVSQKTLILIGIVISVFLARSPLWSQDEVAQVFPSSSTTAPLVGGSPFETSNNSPKEKIGEIAGSLDSIDYILQNFNLTDAQGNRHTFLVDSLTSILDQNLQISFKDLKPGDHLHVVFHIQPEKVDRIERLSLLPANTPPVR